MVILFKCQEGFKKESCFFDGFSSVFAVLTVKILKRCCFVLFLMFQTGLRLFSGAFMLT